MEPRAMSDERIWQNQIYNLFLTIDHLEEIVRHHSFEVFCESRNVIGLVTQSLFEISDLVRRIPLHVRIAHPEVPWPFLRSLDALMDSQIFIDNPAAAWRILNARIIPGATALAPLVAKINRRATRPA